MHYFYPFFGETFHYNIVVNKFAVRNGIFAGVFKSRGNRAPNALAPRFLKNCGNPAKTPFYGKNRARRKCLAPQKMRGKGFFVT